MKNAVKVFAIIGILLALIAGICLYVSFTGRVEAPSSSNVDVLYVGVTEGDYTYTVFSDYTCEITKYSGSADVLKVPKVINTCPVIGIGAYVFEDNDNLLEVVLPKTVRYIEKRAFADCALLKEVVLPASVNYIGDEAFFGCDQLQKVSSKGEISYIGVSAFEGCDSVISVSFPKGVKEIGNRAFYGCVFMEKINLGDATGAIGNYAFGKCRLLTKIVLDDGLTSIGIRAFDGCTSLETIKIPDSVTSIGRYAFEGTPWRNNAVGFVVVGNGILVAAGADVGPEVVVPTNVVTLLDAFENRTDITSVVIPYSVAEIGDGAFMGCTSLEKAEISAITRLGSYAFYGCENLDEVSLPDTLTDVGERSFVGTAWVENDDFVIGGDGILFGCNAEGNHVVIPESVKYVAEAFYNSEYLAVTIGENVEKILPNAFAQSSKLKKVNFSSSVTELGSDSFEDCISLTAVELNEGVTIIDDDCFNGCYALEKISLPSSLVYVGENAFGLCYTLERLDWDISADTVIEDGNEVLRNLLN